jgi:hypothetical protein
VSARRSISVRGVTYEALRAYCAEHDISMSDVVEKQLAPLLPSVPARRLAPKAPLEPAAQPSRVATAVPVSPEVRVTNADHNHSPADIPVLTPVTIVT